MNENDKTEILEPVETPAENITEPSKDGSRRPKWLPPLVAAVCAVILVAAGIIGWNAYSGAKLAEAKEACATAADTVRNNANEYNALLNGDAADAAADDEEIRFDYRLDGDHDLTSLVVRVDASTCMRPYDRGMRREIAPTGQSSTQESQCQHSSGNLMRGNLSTLRSKTKRFELQISAQVPHPVHFSRSISGGIGKLLCGMFCIYRSTITAHYG